MGFREMMNASSIQAENERLKEENRKLQQKLESLGFDDYMEVKQQKEFLEKEIAANKRILANLDAHLEELNARTNDLDEQINIQLKRFIAIRDMNKKVMSFLSDEEKAKVESYFSGN
jgi:chromosome segregation ATPase